MDKIYSTTIGFSDTMEELQDIFNKYDIDKFNTFYYSIMDKELKDALRPYFKKRMFGSIGIE